MDVVFLHGFSENAHVWDSFLPLLNQNHSYYTLDFSKLTFCQTIEEYADWVHAEIEQLGLTHFVLIGHSMGGYISLAYAEKYPEYLAGLGLFHSTALADTDEKKVSRDKTVAFIQKYGAAEFITDFLPKMYSDSFRKRNNVLIAKALEDNLQIPAAALVSATLAMKARKDRTTVLQKLRLPVLMIIGKEDKFIAYDTVLPQISLCEEPYILILNRIAHAGMHEAPVVCANIVDEFIANCY